MARRKLQAADVLDWQGLFLRTDKGKIEGCASNVALILENDTRWAGVIAWDEFAGRLTMRQPAPWSDLLPDSQPGPWQDGDDARLVIWIEREYRFSPSKEARRAALRQLAERHRWHPVREYLEAIVWDKTPRLHSLFQRYFGAGPKGDPARWSKEEVVEAERLCGYLAKVSCWWLMSAAARVVLPEAKVDTMVVLEGPQGIKKSSALRVLAIRPEWFLDSAVPIGEKDGYLALRGKLIVEFQELSSWSRAHRNALKAFVSAIIDSFRVPYGEHFTDWRRQCVFAGTTNDPQYLDDPSGARRVWPVACGTIDLKALARDRDQLWAEALHYVRQNLRWWPEGDEIQAEFAPAQADRQHQDGWKEVVEDWLSTATPTQMAELTTLMLATKVLKLDLSKVDRSVEMRIGGILRSLSYSRHRRMVNGKQKYVYEKPSNPDEST